MDCWLRCRLSAQAPSTQQEHCSQIHRPLLGLLHQTSRQTKEEFQRQVQLRQPAKQGSRDACPAARQNDTTDGLSQTACSPLPQASSFAGKARYQHASNLPENPIAESCEDAQQASIRQRPELRCPICGVQLLQSQIQQHMQEELALMDAILPQEAGGHFGSRSHADLQHEHCMLPTARWAVCDLVVQRHVCNIATVWAVFGMLLLSTHSMLLCASRLAVWLHLIQDLIQDCGMALCPAGDNPQSPVGRQPRQGGAGQMRPREQRRRAQGLKNRLPKPGSHQAPDTSQVTAYWPCQTAYLW